MGEITGVEYDPEALQMFRKNHCGTLTALIEAHQKMSRDLGVPPEKIIGIFYDGQGNITTTLTDIETPGDQHPPGEDQGDRDRRW
jgi:hypothetical protein